MDVIEEPGVMLIEGRDADGVKINLVHVGQFGIGFR